MARLAACHYLYTCTSTFVIVKQTEYLGSGDGRAERMALVYNHQTPCPRQHIRSEALHHFV